jgi:drug/metabolite transporter (DMT)-like permease
MLDFSRVWLPFFYLYGVGGFIFLVGMYIISKSRSLKIERKRHKKWYYVLIFGFLYYIGIHSVFTFAAVDEINISYGIAFFILVLLTRLLFYLFKNSKRYI